MPLDALDDFLFDIVNIQHNKHTFVGNKFIKLIYNFRARS